MSLIFDHHEDALDCAQALHNAGRVYQYRRTVDGKHEISTTGE